MDYIVYSVGLLQIMVIVALFYLAHKMNKTYKKIQKIEFSVENYLQEIIVEENNYKIVDKPEKENQIITSVLEEIFP